MPRIFTILTLLIPLLSPAQPQLAAPDVSGRQIPLVSPPARAIVLFFIASDCPLSNRLIPEMKRLHQRYAAQNVRFWFVYPNSTETPATIRTHLTAYSIDPALAVTDVHQHLAHLASVSTTPQSAILTPDLRTIYTGRINDRYLAIGKERPQPTRHDLADAIAATIAGHRPNPPGGPTVGCSIVGSP